VSAPWPAAAPPAGGADLAARERLDRDLRGLAAHLAPEELVCPALIARGVLETAEYPQAFPHLLLFAAASRDPQAAPGEAPAADLAPTEWCLSPAVCYHIYARLAGTRRAGPAAFTVRGRCFRHEAETAPGRRQIEFEMREIVLVGEEGWVETTAAALRGALAELAAFWGLPGRWEPAEDPFFLPRAAGKAAMQRLLGTKEELRLPTGEALGSVNRHGTFFGERFGISGPAGRPAATSCLAVGLDRWVYAAAVLERLRRCAPAGVAAPAPETPLAELGLDSIAVVGFLVAIEQEFALDLAELPLQRLSTVGDLAAWIAARLAAEETER
jgi:acyl carrier protein